MRAGATSNIIYIYFSYIFILIVFSCRFDRIGQERMTLCSRNHLALI